MEKSEADPGKDGITRGELLKAAAVATPHSCSADLLLRPRRVPARSRTSRRPLGGSPA